MEETCRVGREPGKFAWVTLHEPSREEFLSVAGEFGLDKMAVEDAVELHQRPKIERADNRLFVVLKSARYTEDAGRVEFGEIHAFLEPDFIVTVLYREDPALYGVREEMEGDPELLRLGPAAVLYEIMRKVVEGYTPVVDGIENDLDEVEAEVLGGNAGMSGRIHELSREVIRFHQATKPLAGALEQLVESGAANDLVDPETHKHLRRLRDRVTHVTERIEGFRDLLSSILDVSLTIVGTHQNDQMQRISAWGAILVVPTLIAGIFGMNFEEAWWIHAEYGFEAMLALMVLISVLLYIGFKRSGWL
ncbi:MAG TPA: magnesium and cobalt transport protein CorA [Rubrobacteraceae bacterium]|nr:magnesium and cobalt transport protein CorA [Rubrobacteraceae bacterium]